MKTLHVAFYMGKRTFLPPRTSLPRTFPPGFRVPRTSPRSVPAQNQASAELHATPMTTFEVVAAEYVLFYGAAINGNYVNQVHAMYLMPTHDDSKLFVLPKANENIHFVSCTTSTHLNTHF